MKGFLSSFFVFLFLHFSILVHAQEVKVYPTYAEFEQEIMNIQDDKTYIINFWATWCGPCVKELPFFEEIGKKYQGSDVEVILVSLDFAKYLDRQVKPFINKKGLKNTIVLLDDPKTNDWIDKVDPSWSGAIPITLFKTKENKAFYEKEYHSFEELEKDLNSFLKNNK